MIETVAAVNQTVAKLQGLYVEVIDGREAFAQLSKADVHEHSLLESSDLFIGIVWKRFAPEANRSASGRESEFQNAISLLTTTGKPKIVVFACNKARSYEFRDIAEAGQVNKIKAALDAHAWLEFAGIEDFRESVLNLLFGWVMRYGNDNSNSQSRDKSDSDLADSSKPLQSIEQRIKVATLVQSQNQVFVAGFSRNIHRLAINTKGIAFMLRGHTTWEEIIDVIRRLGIRLRSDTPHPSLTVAIGREGAIIGSVLAVNERLKPFVSVDRDFYVDGGDQRASIHDMLKGEAIAGRVVLVVDCEVNTGASMRSITKYLLDKGAVSVRTLALAVSENATFSPDYIGFRYTKRLHYPWEYSEALATIRHKKPLSERT